MVYLPTACTMVSAALADLPHDERRHEEAIRLAFVEGVMSTLSCLSASSVGDHPGVERFIVDIGHEVSTQRAVSGKLRRL
jgi:hypothetical protein